MCTHSSFENPNLFHVPEYDICHDSVYLLPAHPDEALKTSNFDSYTCVCVPVHTHSRVFKNRCSNVYITFWDRLSLSSPGCLPRAGIKGVHHHCSPVFAISICLSLLPKCECLNSNNCPIHFSHSQLSVIHTKETCMHGPHSRPEVINLVTCRLFLSLFFLLLSFIFQ